MKKEIDALIANQTWILVDLPAGKRAITCKWVFKTKLKANGTLERYKARLVARGYTQQHGIDYSDTFSPVIKMATVRCIILVATSKNWPLHQLDVNNAFLHGDLHEEVYMITPQGFPNPLNQVCKLQKSLYDLKQASRQWFAKLTESLVSLAFVQSKNDYSLFIKNSTTGMVIVAVYVDDIIVTGSDQPAITALKDHLHKLFSIKDLGRLHFFLGIEVTYLKNSVALTQKKFTTELLADSGLVFSSDIKHPLTPLPLNTKLLQNQGPPLPNPEYYRSLVGKLNFLTNTRPDLSYTVQTLSQFMHSPCESHLAALQHTIRYVHGSVGKGIIIHGRSQLTLTAFSDSDWAACPSTRRSVTGYLVSLGGSPITWKSKKQSTVSRSSVEAEYRAMAQASAEVTWIVRVLHELGIHNLTPVTLFCDNISAIHIAKNPVFHERTKHIDIDCHFTGEKVLEGLLQLAHLPTTEQVADILTKVLPSPQHTYILSKLGMISA